MTCTTESIELVCQDGVSLFAEKYLRGPSISDPSSIQHRILCLHGWLDNHRSFCRLAPALMDDLEGGVELVALDFPGHGRSSHKSLDGPTMLLMDYVYYVYDAIQQLKWDNDSVTVIGHSMGAAVGLMYSAAFPVSKLVLLDSLGPHPRPSKDVAKGLRKHIEARIRGKKPSSIYPSLEQAVETRCATAKAFPGNQYISQEAARDLVLGAGKPTDDGQWEFLHDQRVKWPSILFTNFEQVEEMYQTIALTSTKTCLLLAKDGMPFEAAKVARAKDLLKPVVCETVSGSHHNHLDPDTSGSVKDAIINFFRL